MSETAPAYAFVIDRREDVPLRLSYLISCQCLNCGLIHVALFSKGQAAKRGQGLCPFCEVDAELVYRTTEEAWKALGERTIRLLIEREGEYRILTESVPRRDTCYKWEEALPARLANAPLTLGMPE